MQSQKKVRKVVFCITLAYLGHIKHLSLVQNNKIGHFKAKTKDICIEKK